MAWIGGNEKPNSFLHNIILESWWRHQMKAFFGVTGPLCGVFTSHRWALTLSFDVSLMLAKANSQINRRVVGDLRRHDAHCGVIVMVIKYHQLPSIPQYFFVSVVLSTRWCITYYGAKTIATKFPKTSTNLEGIVVLNPELIWWRVVVSPCAQRPG